ncbi:hypothetical protein D3C75_879300 [compost metagenome]
MFDLFETLYDLFGADHGTAPSALLHRRGRRAAFWPCRPAAGHFAATLESADPGAGAGTGGPSVRAYQSSGRAERGGAVVPRGGPPGAGAGGKGRRCRPACAVGGAGGDEDRLYLLGTVHLEDPQGHPRVSPALPGGAPEPQGNEQSRRGRRGVRRVHRGRADAADAAAGRAGGHRVVSRAAGGSDQCLASIGRRHGAWRAHGRAGP